MKQTFPRSGTLLQGADTTTAVSQGYALFQQHVHYSIGRYTIALTEANC